MNELISGSNAFADSCGYNNKPAKVLYDGLSSFGKLLIKEMNRIGMIVDVSHTSAKTAADALTLSKAPIIFSHSNAAALYKNARNVPDEIVSAYAYAQI